MPEELTKKFGHPVTPFDHGYAGLQWRAEFENGYGASIIQGPYSYGGPDGKFELAVTHPDELCYATPVTSDVLGHLTEVEVTTHLDAIKALTKNNECDHDRRDHDLTNLGEAIGSLLGMFSDPRMPR